MTYQYLLLELAKLTEKQLSCDLVVELDISDECLPAELRIAGKEHDLLNEDYPIIFVKDY